MRLFIHILQALLILCNKYEPATMASCSSAYGAKPCPYVPSPPGERPTCAKYGYTYCEYPEHYPRDLVMHLLEKWKYDHGTLLQNETPTEYTIYGPPQKDTYGPPNTIFPYPAPVYGPPPSPTSNTGYDPYANRSPNSYIPPPPTPNGHIPSNNQPHNQSYQYPQHKFPYNSNVYQTVQNPYKSFQPEFNQFHQNIWNKWNGRKFFMRKKRSLMKNHVEKENSTLANNLFERKKRQAGRASESEQLCESFSQFIMPRAAMNSRGDWMYVVNVPEADGRYSQLVKSESCARQGRCSNLCSLPDGYTSRCEQRYVQKRLVAVEPGGGNLYTDIFWFPSCCLCTISRN